MKLRIKQDYIDCISKVTRSTEMEDAEITLDFFNGVEGYHVQIAPYQRKKFIANYLCNEPLSLLEIGCYSDINDAIEACRKHCMNNC